MPGGEVAGLRGQKRTHAGGGDGGAEWVGPVGLSRDRARAAGSGGCCVDCVLGEEQVLRVLTANPRAAVRGDGCVS